MWNAGMKAASCVTNPVVINNNDSGAGSLRQAILDACDGNTITFANTVVSPIVLTSELAIDKNLTIQGPGAGILTISGNNAVRVFNIGSVSSGINVTLSGLTISGGNLPATQVAEGGGILNNSTGMLTINNATISGNKASGSGTTGFGRGGGLLNSSGGTVIISSTTISGNSSSGNSAGEAGGIYNSGGAVDITNSTISGNTGQEGGGIINTGTLSISNSTISGNSSTASRGGGIENAGTLTVINTTISGNLARLFGAGIYNAAGSTLNLTNSTITGNSGLSGVGVLNEPPVVGGPKAHPGGTVNIENTIVAVNTASDSDPDVSGPFTTLGHNLIGEGDGSSGLVNGANGDQVGSMASPLDPKLELDQMGKPLLANHGGPTLTIALLEGSPAIDTGDDTVTGPPLNLATDQRGTGFPRKLGSHVDIGAFEFSCPTINATVSGGGTICPSGSSSVTVTLSGGVAPYTVTLNNSGGTMTGSSPLTFTVKPAMTTTYTVSSGTDSDGCPVTGVGSATVTVDSATTAAVTGGGTICPGGMSSVTVTLNGGTPPYSVTLNNGGGSQTGASPLTFLVSPSTTTTYTVASGMDSIGCSVTGSGSATVTVNSAPMVTVNPANQTLTGGGSVTFTAGASGSPTPTVQWQVSVNGGAFTNIPGATSTTLTFTPTPSQSGNKYRAVFTNTCGVAMTNAAALTIFDQCLKDDSTGNLFQFNSATGQYIFTRCSDGFNLGGIGTTGLVNGIQTLKDSKSDRRVTAGSNQGSHTGSATIYLMVGQGVWETFRINATRPAAVCSCSV
jgi:hypothetical protein